MPPRNSYPEFPILPYQKTTVEMADVIAYIQQLDINKEVKRSLYVIFRNESANGKAGINNNFIGFQSDSGKWQAKYDKHIVGTTIKVESRTGKERGFICFAKWQDSIDILADKVAERGMYVGGKTNFITNTLVRDKNVLADVYMKEWVTGQKNYKPTATEISSFVSMYNQAVKLFA